MPSWGVVNVYGPRIAKARKAAGLTQQALADALGVNVQTIKRRESKTGKEPKKVDRIAIAAVCGVSTDYMEGVIDDIELATDAVVRKLREQDQQLAELRGVRDEISELRRGVQTLTATVAQHGRALRELRDPGHQTGSSEDGPQ